MVEDTDIVFINTLTLKDDSDFKKLETAIATLLKCYNNRCAFLMTEKFIEIKVLILKCLRQKAKLNNVLQERLNFTLEQEVFKFPLQQGLQVWFRQGGENTIFADLYWVFQIN